MHSQTQKMSRICTMQYMLNLAEITVVEFFIAMHEEQVWPEEKKAWYNLTAAERMASLTQRVATIASDVHAMLEFIACFADRLIPTGADITVVHQMAEEFAHKHNTPFGVIPNLMSQDVDSFDSSLVNCIVTSGIRSLRNSKRDKPEAVTLSDSVILLFLNIMQVSLMKPKQAEWDVSVWPPMSKQGSQRAAMCETVRLYRKLREKYPTLVVDSVFDNWVMGITLNDNQTIERYIDDYDFGPMHPPESEWGPYPEEFARGERGGYIVVHAIEGERYARVCRGHFTSAAGPVLACEYDYDDPDYAIYKGVRFYVSLDSWVQIEQFYDTALYNRYIAAATKN